MVIGGLRQVYQRTNGEKRWKARKVLNTEERMIIFLSKYIKVVVRKEMYLLIIIDCASFI